MLKKSNINDIKLNLENANEMITEINNLLISQTDNSLSFYGKEPFKKVTINNNYLNLYNYTNGAVIKTVRFKCSMNETSTGNIKLLSIDSNLNINIEKGGNFALICNDACLYYSNQSVLCSVIRSLSGNIIVGNTLLLKQEITNSSLAYEVDIIENISKFDFVKRELLDEIQQSKLYSKK